jgi:hypothetical protein
LELQELPAFKELSALLVLQASLAQQGLSVPLVQLVLLAR